MHLISVPNNKWFCSKLKFMSRIFWKEEKTKVTSVAICFFDDESTFFLRTKEELAVRDCGPILK